MAEPAPGERGAALLTVLLLVAVLAVIATTALDRLSLATRLSGNALLMQQARAVALSAEAIAVTRVSDLIHADAAQTTLQGNWQGTPISFAVPGGTATARIYDGSNCFNLNSLVSGRPGQSFARPQGVDQFIRLLDLLGVPGQQAQTVAAATADWIDADDVPLPGGAEAAAYAGLQPDRRPPNRPMGSSAEFGAVLGVSPELAQRLAPWLCALPTEDLSPINVNTLAPEQAPLLAMLDSRLSLPAARAALASRPAAGYGSSVRFWSSPSLRGVGPSGATGQIGLRTSFLRLQTDVRLGAVGLAAQAMIDATGDRARVVQRDWTGR